MRPGRPLLPHRVQPPAHPRPHPRPDRARAATSAAPAGLARASRTAAAPAARAAAAPVELEVATAGLGCGVRAICAQVEVGREGKELKWEGGGGRPAMAAVAARQPVVAAAGLGREETLGS